MDFYVYAHIRLDTETIFYIGKGRKNRAYRKERNRHWTSIVNKAGYRVEFLKRNLPEVFAFELETKMIKDLKLIGQCEANYTLGGEGCSGYKWSEEQRLNQSKRQRSNSVTILEGRKKQAKKIKGRTKETHAGLHLISVLNAGARNGRAIWNIVTEDGVFGTIREAAGHYKISTTLVHKRLKRGVWKRERK